MRENAQRGAIKRTGVTRAGKKTEARDGAHSVPADG